MAAEQAAQAEADRIAVEQAAKAEADRIAVEQAAQAEADRIATEQAAKAEAERIAADQAAKAEADRIAVEQVAKAEADRIATEKAAEIQAQAIAEEVAAAARVEDARVVARQEEERIAEARAAAEFAAIEEEERAALEQARQEAEVRAAEGIAASIHEELEADASTNASEDERDTARDGREKPRRGFFARMKAGLGKTRANLTEGVASLFLGKKQIDDELMEDLETQLLMADVGIEATTEIIDNLTARISRKELKEPEALYQALQEELRVMLAPVARDIELPPKGSGPFVILMIGVNGVGKTTTIGKLAKRYQSQGRSVMLAAGDTFRAAAVEQLKVWGERNKVPVIAQHTGADSASVIYDALEAAKARNVDILIADTAGRLHNKSHLMEELKKVQRVMAKLDVNAPHEVMLVLDAGTGQNALAQATTFHEAVNITGLTLTKLDGTAKGGIIFALAKQLNLPIRYIGVGEGVDDLRPFAADDFVSALFARSGEEVDEEQREA
ncbi:signal recognition particle-docking protein FtsY [Cobetia crustatorum]|uniref:Signal recognition particle receptor FtsY n=1 Tax=Cobetia crustatorum TaxID=553385 RepID=A0A558HH53_9GAMM|nr:signal recognition particle-docking protein FtsY [Cobetia crustatorum]